MPSPVPLRLLIVDDNTHFLAAARTLLEGDGMTVVGVATDGTEAVRLSEELRPDLALVDIDLGEESGPEIAFRLREAAGHRSLAVILISAYPEEDFAELIQASSAVGFLPKAELSASAILDLLDRTEDGGP